MPIADMVYMTPGRGGLSFSPFPLGSSITMIPFYMLGDEMAHLFPGIPHTFIIEFCYSMINPLCTAVTCLVLYGICLMLGYSIRTSIVTALIFGFCSIAWPYAKTTWSEPQATLCVLGGLYGLLRFNATNKHLWLCLGGIAVGYGFLTKLEMSIYAADGQIIRQLVRRHLIAGSHRLRWDATDNAGRSVASGTYLLYLRTPDGLRRSKLTLLR